MIWVHSWADIIKLERIDPLYLMTIFISLQTINTLNTYETVFDDS